MAKIRFATLADGTTKFYPVTIAAAIVDQARNQRLSATLTDIYNKLSILIYEDVYIGTGANYLAVMIPANHHDLVMRGDKISITASSSKVRIVMPSSYTPTLMMSGIEVPIALSNTITVDEKEYKVWATSNVYTGTFDVFMF